MKVIISGGGTGGHIYPAIAIANTIKKKDPDAEIIFTGNRDSLENDLVPKAGYEIYHIESCGFNRKNMLKNFRFAYYYFTSPLKGKKLIREFKPDVVIGTGGYACWPIMKAAIDLGVPTLVHESNSIPGLAIKRMAPLVHKILVNYAKAGQTLGYAEKTVRVGNPLREDFGVISKEVARRKISAGKAYSKYILSYGGSGGAEQINLNALYLMKNYVCKHPDVMHVHITGKKSYDSMLRQFNAMGLNKYDNIVLLPYTHEMSYYMGSADLVICRAGALTISELALTRKAAILIPSPNVTANHQYHNAKTLADKGAAILIEENELNEHTLASVVSELLASSEKLMALSDSIAEFAVDDSNDRIYSEIVDAIKNQGQKK